MVHLQAEGLALTSLGRIAVTLVLAAAVTACGKDEPSGTPATQSTSPSSTTAKTPTAAPSPSGFAIPGGIVEGPHELTVPVGGARNLTLTPVLSLDGNSLTVAVELKGASHAPKLSFAWTVATPGGGISARNILDCSRPTLHPVDLSRTLGTWPLKNSSGEVRIETNACSASGETVLLSWSGTVMALRR